MLIQGNTDERGSREYNLSLGRNSDAVKRSLTLLGATESQVESVSLGEEKPKNPATTKPLLGREPPPTSSQAKEPRRPRRVLEAMRPARIAS